MKSAKLEWALDALPEALTLVQEGLTKFQDSDKLWMMKGQLQVLARNLIKEKIDFRRFFTLR